jgi:hypothetical protein
MWLDVNGPVFRRRLLEAMYDDHTNKFQDMAKRAFRFNYTWWRQNATDFND